VCEFCECTTALTQVPVHTRFSLHKCAVPEKMHTLLLGLCIGVSVELLSLICESRCERVGKFGVRNRLSRQSVGDGRRVWSFSICFSLAKTSLQVPGRETHDPSNDRCSNAIEIVGGVSGVSKQLGGASSERVPER
jgi:hypothetical protein